MSRIALVVLCLPALWGCKAKRTLTITSDPPGALVRLDDEQVGFTPRKVRFDHYGIRRVTLYKAGYSTHSERVDLSPPWYARFPLDLVTEVLLPIGWHDHRALHVQLDPGEVEVGRPALRSVLERANILRRAGPEGPRDLPTPQAREAPTAGDPPPPPAENEGP